MAESIAAGERRSHGLQVVGEDRVVRVDGITVVRCGGVVADGEIEMHSETQIEVSTLIRSRVDKQPPAV